MSTFLGEYHFADQLNMPMGFALGYGGVWVAADSELLFLKDTDGDDRADHREVVLTGFGNGDTHQNISNLVFDAGGYLYFSQGLHSYAQVETPWGISRGDTAGFWRFDPRRTRLDPFGFPSMTSQNPCGIALDPWGALFVKSNDPQLCFATPALVPTTHPRELMKFASVGQTPGKSMGGEIVASAHLPEWIQGQAIIAGYFAREVSAIPLVSEGAGFSESLPTQLVYGEHESFRPVDIRQGPDGAIYIADWFNPIINHYQVSLRHPDRDYAHGRIWRLSAKGREAMQRPDLAAMTLPELVEQLRSPETWVREQARRLLSDAPETERAIAALRAGFAKLEPGEAIAQAEMAGVLESLDAVDEELLDRLQASPEARVRAIVGRIIARAALPIPDAERRLAALLADPHPRPRLEAVIACANRPGAESLTLALSALDAGEDRFVEYSLAQAVFALEKDWFPALREGRLAFSRPAHLAFVLETYGDEVSLQLVREALEGEVTGEDRRRLLVVLARTGATGDLGRVFAEAVSRRDGMLLQDLAALSETRRPTVDSALVESLQSLLKTDDPEILKAAIHLAGNWRVTGLNEALQTIAQAGDPSLRALALVAFAKVARGEALPFLRETLDDSSSNEEVREAAIEGFALVDIERAATYFAKQLSASTSSEKGSEKTLRRALPLLSTILVARGGPAALVTAIKAGDSLDKQTAQELLNTLNRLGRHDTDLLELLNHAIGGESGRLAYDPDRVAAIVVALREGKGNPTTGAEIYRRAQLACTACHQIGDEGGVIGPDLNRVGAGMPLDQIVESILWPDRQIKEGYQAIAFTTKSGASITGYIERESDELIWYRDTGAPWIKPLAKTEITSRQTIPTLMPAGLTASLSEQEFLDLVAYLASLKG